MKSEKKDLVIGMLGMADNKRTEALIDFLIKNSVSLSFVIYWKPKIRDNYKRIRRKLKASGTGPTLRRIYYALIKSKDKNKNHHQLYHSIREYFTTGHNSMQCQQILKQERVDILLLATDAIIRREVFEIPRLATLNAHPGWVPLFRGLGSTCFQLESGKFPAVSVHKVDEGVDTGPLILRRYIEVDPKQGLKLIEEQVNLLQFKLLSQVVKLFERERIEFIDTFHESSNMTKGMRAKDRKRLDRQLKSGKIMLCPPDQQ